MRSYYSKLQCSIQAVKNIWHSLTLPFFQVVLSFDTPFVPQFSWLNSHGLCSLAPGPNTDVIHLCESHCSCT